MERVGGIEPPPKDWKSFVLPLNYTRTLGFLPRDILYQIPILLLQIYHVILTFPRDDHRQEKHEDDRKSGTVKCV